MQTEWTCGEKLTAVAAGCVGLAIADPGTIAGGAIAGAGLLSLWGKAKLKDGVGSGALLDRVRKRVGAGFEAWAAGHPGAEADIRAADAAMAKHLADCVPPIADLAKTTYDDEDFPTYAAHLIVERLAEKNAMFSTTSDIRVPAAREFALAVVQGALTEAKSVEPFMLRLSQEVVLLIPQHLQRIERKVEAGFAAQDAQFAELKAMLSSQLGIPIEVLGREIAAILELNPATSYAELCDDLRGYKQKHDDLAAQLDRVLVVDNRIAALKADAEDALAAYDHDAADRIFGEMRAVEDERIAAGMKRSAEYADGQAQARMLKRNWRGAAEVWMDAGRKLAVFDAAAAGILHHKAGRLLFEFGDNVDGEALDAAITAYRMALEVFDCSPLSSHWGNTQNSLGNALSVLGQRSSAQSGIALQRDAVAAHRAALKVRTREASPSTWAISQHNLATALQELGVRIDGETGLALLSEAVEVYRAALEVRTRDQVPHDWAMTQNNLGNTLQSLGERIEGSTGAALLGEAVVAHRAALEKRTRGELPKAWAATQNNLGNTLRIMGQREVGLAGAKLLGEAVAAYRQALEVRTRDDMPIRWAMTQFNLGNALQVQGERNGGEAGIAMLTEAVTILVAALEVRTRDALPADWARTQKGLAKALTALAEAEIARRCEHLAAARAAVCEALTVFTPEHMPYGTATELLADIEAQIAEHCPATP